LTVKVVGGNGTVDPNSGSYYYGSVVTVTATPDPGYYVKGWYDPNGALVSIKRTFDVLMDTDHTYIVEFRLPEQIYVGGDPNAILDAVDEAENGDTLIVAPGIYNGNINLQGKEIKLFSMNPDDPSVVASTIIEGGLQIRGFIFNSGEDSNTVINGFTIVDSILLGEGGAAIFIGDECSPTIANVVIDNCILDNASGGAIRIGAKSKAKLSNVTISNCLVNNSNGGGIYIGIESNPILTGCTVTGCWIFRGVGGGIYCAPYSYPTFIDCTIANNYADIGGRIFLDPDDPTIIIFIVEGLGGEGAGIYFDNHSEPNLTGCVFSGNVASTDGGGVFCNYHTTITATDCNFVDNIANYGAGMLLDANCSGIISDSIFISNDANEDGGGLYFTDSNELLIVDCNISYNIAASGGGLCAIDSPGARIERCSIKYNEGRRLIYEFYRFDPNDPLSVFDPNRVPDANGTLGDPNYLVVSSTDNTAPAHGGGIYSVAGPALIRDCDIGNNIATTSGGGVYLASYYSDPNIIGPLLQNCLITDNTVGRDGAGVSANWLSEPIISNCTIADNIIVDVNGFGAGLFCSYQSNVEVIDSIIWGNGSDVAIYGSQIAVATGNLPYPLPSNLKVSYSLVQGWQDVNEPNWIDPNAVFVDVSCPQPAWDFNSVFDADPLFVSGYYLSQIAAGQSLDSPGVDTGSGYADDPDIDLARYTTRIDGINDVDIVDMGYHYQVVPYRLTVYVEGNNGSVEFDPNGVWIDPNSRSYNKYAVVTLRSMPDPNYRIEGWYDVNDVLLSIEKELDVVMDSDKVFKVRYELPSKTYVFPVVGDANVIQQAINEAKDGDILIVAAGVYNGNINTLGKDITLVCTNPDDPNVINHTVIDAQVSGRGFIFNSNEGPNTIIDGFTIINGNLVGEGGGAMFIDANTSPTIKNVVMNNHAVIGADGGAIYVDANSRPKFINCIITNCSADNGGGAHCDANSAPIFYHCTFINNSAALVGGALLCDPNASITINDCNFLDNTAIYGGALYCAENSSGRIVSTIIERNDANEYGGAMYLAEANDLSIVDCNISYNIAGYGGGVYSFGSLNLNISRSTLSFNSAPLTFIDPNDPNTEIVGQGGGMFFNATEALIRDCVLNHNTTNTSGGGIYLLGESDFINIINCLIINNLAGRDGGGISANWFAEPNITSCTFVSNAAPGVFGQAGTSGFGGGLYCSYLSRTMARDCILWDNYALNGYEIAVATGFEFDPYPSKLMISYSDIKRTALAVMVDRYCALLDPTDPTGQAPLEDTLHPGAVWDPNTNNIDLDPLFVPGPLGDHYLSHIEAGQDEDSPCIDAGSDLAVIIGLEEYTTRSDNLTDVKMVDMGYHYPIGPEREKCRLCDLIHDGIIDFNDLAVFISHWLDEGCLDLYASCEGTDFTYDTYVDFDDYAFFANCWLVEDVCAPVPNPMEWLRMPHLTTTAYPYSISMTAKTAFDAWSWPVQYYFQCVFGDCHDSGWQDETTYEDTGLKPSVYGYRVRARDVLPGREPNQCNLTEWSVVGYSGTGDVTPPAPVPAIILIEPVSPNSIRMIASEAYDESGVQYYFEALTAGAHDSNWLDEPNYTDVNLVPDTTYCYRVKARDMSDNHLETIWSPPRCTATAPPPDNMAPLPDPMQWDDVNDANGFSGFPMEILMPPGGQFDYGVTMRAIDADDQAPAGVAPAEVEYYFECLDDSGFNSGWRTVADYPVEDNRRTYTVKVGISGQFLRFRVRARDASDNLNMTDWSVPYPAQIP
jgi:parallel beta-helix repeat protein